MKLIKTIAIICAASFVFCITSSALAGDCYSWYCKRNKEHLQPEIDPQMKFIEDFDCYYVDKNHNSLSDEKVVYLTFDAGYENGNIEKILDTLKSENVKGSFFILENLLRKNPELVCRMVNDGNIVYNHTATHKDISKLKKEELEKEIKNLEELFKAKTGRELTKCFRPPEGKFSRESLEIVSDMGYKTVFWSFAYADWDNSKQPDCDFAFEKIISNMHNGAIILLHPTSSTNATILPKLIKYLKAEGYSFETVDNL